MLKIQQYELAKIFKNALSHKNSVTSLYLYSQSNTWRLWMLGLFQRQLRRSWQRSVELLGELLLFGSHTTLASMSSKNFKFLERRAWRIVQPCDACHGWGRPVKFGLEKALLVPPNNKSNQAHCRYSRGRCSSLLEPSYLWKVPQVGFLCGCQLLFVQLWREKMAKMWLLFLISEHLLIFPCQIALLLWFPRHCFNY